MAKKQEQVWVDELGDLNTWDEVVDAAKVQNKINYSLHRLLIHHKVPAKEVANAIYQARADYYGWKKEVRYRPTIKDQKPEPVKAASKKKQTKSRRDKRN